MAEKITKLKYESGDPINTSSDAPKCPNNHPLAVRVNRAKGQGRHFCPQCSWSDNQSVMGSTGPQAPEQPKVVGSKPQDRHSKGVTVISQRGIENRGRPNVVSR